ncbi:MAG: M23 family metallopeptidase [Polyangiaceae bacterium]|jgi:hypothetical protein|nr:M23 family metallopeptidase [Polyangiaceae bacterium]
MTPEVAPSPSLRARLSWLPPLCLGGLTLGVWLVFLSGRGMSSVVAWLLLLSVVPLAGVLFLLAGAALALLRRRRSPGRALSRPLKAALLVGALAAWTAAWNVGYLGLAFPVSLKTTAPAATGRLPMQGPVQVLWGGDALEHNHHAMFPDQRWAYDLGVPPVLSGSKKLADHGCWGVEVVAPLAGRVHLAHDGEPDRDPGPSGDLLAPLGNHVAIELPSRTYLVIAHLQRGSVLVREGEQVQEGQPLGRCGNSGNTSEPHVHLHHQRQDPRGRPINFAEGLPLFFRDHDGEPMPRGGISVLDGKVTPTGALVRHLPPGAR